MKKGFTLVEIIAVVAIIAILSVSAVVGVNAIINNQRMKAATMAESSIKEASISYFTNKKTTYVDACRDNDDDYTIISQHIIKDVNDKLRKEMQDNHITDEKAKYEYAKKYANDVNTKSDIKEQFNNEYTLIKNTNCFKLVTVGELIDEGLVTDTENMCNKASVIFIYQKGDTRNTTGIITNVQEDQICNGKKEKRKPPVLTVNPDKDTTAKVDKTINISIVDENKKLKNPVELYYGWSKSNHNEPTDWKPLNISIQNRKKGSNSIYAVRLSGENYLWIKSKGEIDGYKNTISPFPSGPYNFLKIMNLRYDDRPVNGCSMVIKEVIKSYKYGENVHREPEALCTTSRDGYDFQGWMLDGVKIDEDTEVTKDEDHIVIANWNAKTCNITLNKNGATNTPTNKLTVKFDTSVLNPSTITLPIREYKVTFSGNSTGASISSLDEIKSNYTFESWNSSEGTAVINNSATPALKANVTNYTGAGGKWIKDCDATLTAKWTGQEITLPTITKTGYTCGWATSSTGSKVYNSGQKITPTADMSLYGTCSPNTYTISYDLKEGGNPSKKPTSGTYDADVEITNSSKTITITPDANSTGATVGSATSGAQEFAGWTSTTLGSHAKTGPSANPTGEWTGASTKNTHFKNLRESGTVTMIANWTAKSITLPTLTPPPGKDCKYYTAKTGGTLMGSGGASWTPTDPNGSTSVKAYVRCTANDYVIAYNLQGGSDPSKKPTSGTYGADVEITNPSKTITITPNANSTGASVGSATSGAQEFAGWTSTTLGTNAKAGNSAKPIGDWTGSSTKYTHFMNLRESGTVTMIANWTAKAITLPTLTAPAGKDCKYYTASTGGTLMGNGGASWTPTAPNGTTSITAYARCTPKVFTITLDNQSATTAGTATIYEKYGNGWYSDSTAATSISSITKPTKSGYKFAGYYTSGGVQIIDENGAIKVANTYFTANTTITARWTPYYVRLYYNGKNNNTTIPTAISNIEKTEKNADEKFSDRTSTYYFITSSVIATGQTLTTKWCGSTTYKLDTNYNAVYTSNNSSYYVDINYGTNFTMPTYNTGDLCFQSDYYKGKPNAEWKIGSTTIKQGASISAKTLASYANCNLDNGNCTATASVNWVKNNVSMDYYCNGGVEWHGHVDAPYTSTSDACYHKDYGEWDNTANPQAPGNHNYYHSCNANYVLQKENYVPTSFFAVDKNNGPQTNELTETPDTATLVYFWSAPVANGGLNAADYFTQLKTRDVNMKIYAKFTKATTSLPYKTVCELCWDYEEDPGDDYKYPYSQMCKKGKNTKKHPYYTP